MINERFKNVENRLKKADCNGSIFLVGAGILETLMIIAEELYDIKKELQVANQKPVRKCRPWRA